MMLDVLPPRQGERPETGPAVPHVQFTQTSPPEIHAELEEWMRTGLPGTVVAPSEISDTTKMRAFLAKAFPDAPITHDVETAVGLFLDGTRAPDGVLLLPPTQDVEFAHLHPDGSLHVSLAPEDREILLATGWGERHPLYQETLPILMLYAPRTSEELNVTRTGGTAAYRYAAGLDQAGGHSLPRALSQSH
jgi:hypothetical protein